jgi:hypothetical protein
MQFSYPARAIMVGVPIKGKGKTSLLEVDPPMGIGVE